MTQPPERKIAPSISIPPDEARSRARCCTALALGRNSEHEIFFARPQRPAAGERPTFAPPPRLDRDRTRARSRAPAGQTSALPALALDCRLSPRAPRLAAAY